MYYMMNKAGGAVEGKYQNGDGWDEREKIIGMFQEGK